MYLPKKPNKSKHFRKIPDTNAYFIDVHGNVVSMTGKEPRILKQCTNEKGYKRVLLVNCEGRKVSYLVHRLVLSAWDRLPIDGEEACHRNGKRDYNRLTNLYWGSKLENLADRVLCTSEKSHLSILTNTKVKNIREKHKTGLSITELSKKYKVNYTTVMRIIENKTWKGI